VLESSSAFTKTVYNLAPTEIPGNADTGTGGEDVYIPVARDKWGTWLAMGTPVSGYTGEAPISVSCAGGVLTVVLADVINGLIQEPD
jgi:hypothetical protein